MSMHSKWFRLWCLSIVVGASSLHAETKGITWSGNAEAGYRYDWNGTNNVSNAGFSVDSVKLKTDVVVSDKTKFVMTNMFFLGTASGTALGNTFGSSNYWSPAAFTGGGSTPFQFVMANQQLYIDHKCGEGFHTIMGNQLVNFGMENMWDRYDMATYYYSMTGARAQSLGWWNDVGVKFNISEAIPGNLEIGVFDGRTGQTATTTRDAHVSPSVALRYNMETKSGDMSFTPVVSAIFGRFSGAPRDMGITAGAMFKSGALGLNGEFLWLSRNPSLDGTATATSTVGVWLEPSFDLAAFSISAKGEWMSQSAGASTSDLNIGAAIAHTYEGGYRVKLSYMHAGLSGNLANHTNELRLQFGTKF